MSSQIEYNQMPREPAPAVLSEHKISSQQPGLNQPMTMDQSANLRGGGDGGCWKCYVDLSSTPTLEHTNG
ncbi:uncharacterized protein BDZ83DRAFT_598735 [Colletotrichum acutatum]|uniref:Uncharacterized protein n=1 Tax=Glomerella acutata TaxID=27357 RepID=A0AAD8XPT9_GLOAC|nr:uncharacterized protein BDZ83DRAFT_598735 [Colletotrichum acutatum]KAK1731314.1 hypothetical protein BDZ83DRAFT_598735 [Colletotrichum acutatum]